MSRRITAAASLVAILTASSAAASSNAIVAGVVAGTAAGSAARTAPTSPATPAVTPGWMTEDWVDPRTGFTNRLVYGCGHIAELGFTTTASQDHLLLHLYNEGHVRSTVRSEDVTVRFPSGRERRLVPALGTGHLAIDPGWWASASFRFPEKEDFDGQDSMTLGVPVHAGGACTIEVDVVRHPDVPRDPRTSTRYQRMEIYLAGGPHLGSSGGPARAAGSRGGMFEIGGAWYPAIHHGFTFDLMADFFGPSGRRFEQTLGPFGKHPRMTGVGPFAGYALRGYVAPWLSASIGTAVGAYVLSLADDDDTILEEGYLVTYSRLRVDAILGFIDPESAFAIGASVAHHYLPSGSFAGVDVSGTHYSAALRVTLGGM